MNIIDKMEKEALIFMHKRKKIEEDLIKKMVITSKKMQKEILSVFGLQDAINISLLYYFINREIKPIVEKYKAEKKRIIDSAIRDNFEVGIENGQRLLSISNDSRVPPLDNELNNQYYEEVLIALLLFGERLLDSLGEDTINNLNKDATSIYISGKNIRQREAEKEVDSNNNSTLSTVIKGSIIGKYINSTFKDITIRADLIARNETNRALNHGHMMRYLRASGSISGLMVKWAIVEDERLCHYCRAAGQGGDLGIGVYPIEDITPPPLHSRCRCILIPYTEIWNEITY